MADKEYWIKYDKSYPQNNLQAAHYLNEIYGDLADWLTTKDDSYRIMVNKTFCYAINALAGYDKSGLNEIKKNLDG